MSEIVPTLISEVLNHLKDDVNKEVVSVNIKNEIEPLKDFVKEHVETVQDILHVNDSQMQANIEQVRHDLKELTQKQQSQYTSLMEHLSSITEHENHRFEQIKRRLGDVGQTMSNLQNKINSSVVQEPREQPPHLHYNNPFLNQPHIPPPVQQMNTPTVVEPRHTNPVNTVVPDKKKAEWELLSTSYYVPQVPSLQFNYYDSCVPNQPQPAATQAPRLACLQPAAAGSNTVPARAPRLNYEPPFVRKYQITIQSPWEANPRSFDTNPQIYLALSKPRLPPSPPRRKTTHG
ncbi:hypothetical protein KEM48_003339 [Puccinia striiformis f. sp. tritici PST-130]|nr:hypothetical protein KEM48_003339 [Puccinia striiformis f. sp. tritici PST-130]